MKNKYLPIIFLSVIIFLILIGISFSYSASSLTAYRYTKDSFYFFKQHIFSVILGVMIFLATQTRFVFQKMIIKPNRTNPQVPFFLITFVGISILLLIMIFIPGFSRMTGGARRWFTAGPFSFQPSELAKAALILYLPALFEVKGERLKYFKTGVVPPLIILIFISVLIAFEPDLSTTVLILISCFLIFFLAEIPPIFLATVMSATIPFFILILETKKYAAQRFIFLDPFSDPYGKGYHLLKSFQSFQAGGLFGIGPGLRGEALRKLPESHTDFIFAVVGGETGYVGAILLILLFIILAYTGFKIAFLQETKQKSLTAAGITIMLTLQALLHIFVNTGLIPTTGLPLPFISYGKSAMAVQALFAGILYKLSKETLKPEHL